MAPQVPVNTGARLHGRERKTCGLKWGTGKVELKRWISVRNVALFLGLAAGFALAAWSLHKYWPRRLNLPRPHELPALAVENGRIVIRVPGSHLVGELARYDDELFSYMMFDYLRTRPVFADTDVLLTYSLHDGIITYVLKVVLPNDLVTGLPKLYELTSQFPFLTADWVFIDGRMLHDQRSQTETFVRAYNFPAYRKLEQLSQKDVVAYAKRFIRFKSSTDPRIRRQIEPVPHALSQDEAQQLAEDISSVTNFYALPLDFFLGIGAMENNFMNVKGDLGHAVWKKRAAKGDVILRRRRGRVLILNEASGVWQITRETLRYAHSLYLRDKRDYSRLPEHLRPPRDLDVAGLDHRVLTTYAGLLFRDLLDRLGGDVGKAVGAYNGGPGNPNAQYEAGVRLVADYARRMLEQAAALDGQRAVDLELMRPARTSGR